MNIGDSDFQLVCDVFLYLDKKLYALSRTGAMPGKNKTKKGRPDSYFIQEDNTFVFVEATTLHPGNGIPLLKKLKKDWRACTDPSITGVPINQISAIYLCANSDVPPAYERELMEMGESAGIPTRIISLSHLALGIRYRYPTIARDQLRLHIDTGQLLAVDEFIQEYDKSPTVTSLAFTLYGRETDLMGLCTKVANHDALVLIGKPGIGKSRLALETLRRYQLLHPSYTLFCLSNKNAELLPDLQSQLAPDADYLIMVDDAHRQIDHLKTLLGFYRGKKKGHLKFLLTTRDFMKDTVISELAAFEPSIHRLKALPQETIWQLCTEAFRIEDTKVLARISTLSRGNARRAVMAAKSWQKSQDFDSLRNIEHLYNDYFEQFSDSGLLKDPKSLAALALVGFFHHIDLDNADFMERLAAAFGLDRWELADQIDRLGRAEMVDVHENGSVFVADQILANFAFYQAFVKKKVLSFKTLLQVAFPSYPNQLRDMLVPLMDSVGNDSMLDALQSDMDSYWQEQKDNRPNALAYLSFFGSYQPDLTFSYLWEQIKPMPEIRKPDGTYRQQPRPPFVESYIRLLTIYFDQPGDHYQRAMGLMFEYITRKPSLRNDVEKALLENLLGHQYDVVARLDRVVFLLAQLEQGYSRHFVFRDLYSTFLPRYLLRAPMMADGGTLPEAAEGISERISEVRRRIWQFQDRQWDAFPEKITETIKSYIDLCIEWNVVSFQDLSLLTDLITNHFQPGHFPHCYLVFRLEGLLEDTGRKFAPIADLRLKFVNPRFLLFQKLLGLPMPRRRRAQMPASDYEEQRAEQVRKLVPVKNLPEFKRLYGELIAILSFPIQERSQMITALDVVVHESYLRSASLGLRLVQYVRDKGNALLWWPSLLMKECLGRSGPAIRQLYNVLRAGVCRDQDQWVFRFYTWLPPEKVTKGYAVDLLSFFPSTARIDFYWIYGLEKFANHLPGFFPKLIRSLFDRGENNAEFSYALPHDFFARHKQSFRKMGALTSEVYLQQAKMDEQYDQLGTELCCLLPEAPLLMEDLIRQKLARDPIKHVSIKDFSGVWQLKKGESHILSALQLIGKHPHHYAMKDFGQSFFWKLKGATFKKATGFCRGFIEQFFDDVAQLNQLLQLIRMCLPDYYPELVGHLVQVNDDLPFFQKLQLLNNHFSSNSRDDIWADHRVTEYQVLLSAIRKLPNNFKYSGHIVYLQKQIAWERRMATEERKRRALFEYWSRE
jgi:hypothetical protein